MFRRPELMPLHWFLLVWHGVTAPFAGAEGTATKSTDKIRVITYNVQFLPDPASSKNERPNPIYRASRIAEEVSQFDIVALQETFHDIHRQALREQVEAAWNGRASSIHSPTPKGFFTSGGCLLLSRLPFAKTGSTVYKNFSKPADYGLRADGFAAKGVIHARVISALDGSRGVDNVPAECDGAVADCVDCFVTHLEARDDALRPRQYLELAAFVKEQSKADSPVLILGDLNTRGGEQFRNEPESQYAALVRALQAVKPDGEVVDTWPHLKGAALGGTTHQESPEIGKRIDYIFLINPPRPHAQLNPLSAQVRLFQDPQIVALSDHNAVVAEFEWSR